MLMNGIAFVIAKILPETNYYTCSRSGQINKTVRILSCKILWCWISVNWAAVFLNEIRRSELDTFFCSMNNDVQVQLLIANWTEASGNTQYHIVAHRLYNNWEIAVICFAPAMIVLMRGVQDPEERDERVKRAYTERLLSVILRERERASRPKF